MKHQNAMTDHADHPDPFVRGLARILEDEGIRPATLAREAGLGVTLIRDLFRYQSSPRIVTAQAIADALGRSIDEIIAIGGGAAASTARPVAIVARAGAGAEVFPIDDHARGDGLYHVTRPVQLRGRSVVGIEIVGDSMAPTYQPGDIVFYERNSHEGVPDGAINRICIAEDDQGRVWLKQVKRGVDPGTFNLISLNPAGDHIHGVRLKWAAPVLMHMPRDMARRA